MPNGTLGIDLDLSGEDSREKTSAQSTSEIGPPPQLVLSCLVSKIVAVWKPLAQELT